MSDDDMVFMVIVLVIGLVLGTLVGAEANNETAARPLHRRLCHERYAHAATAADSLRVAQDSSTRWRCPVGGDA